jgi:hypothetical protein
MRPIRHPRLIAAALALLASVAACPAQAPSNEELQAVIIELREQNRTLQRALVEANRSERSASDKLTQVQIRLEALGKNLLDGGDDRLIQAAADLQLAHERIVGLETAANQLSSNITDYLRQAVVSDPDARLRVESSLRELDALLGLRQKPRPDVRTGTLQQARVVSLDQESGMMVFNLGESHGAKIGMTFILLRGQQPYGKAILADVRKGISGAFVESLDNPTESPRPGDLAVLATQP